MAIAVAPTTPSHAPTTAWEVDLDLLPNEDDVRFYEEHGYWVAPKILPDELIDEAMRGAERHWAGERDWSLPISAGYSDWKNGGGPACATTSTSRSRTVSSAPSSSIRRSG